MDPQLLESLEKLMADGCEDYALTINPPYGDFLLDTFTLATKTLLLKKAKKLYDKYILQLVTDECENDEYTITIKLLHEYLRKSKMLDIFVIVLDEDKVFEIDPKDYEIDDDSDSVIFNVVDIEEDDTLEDTEASIDYAVTTFDEDDIDSPLDAEILNLQKDKDIIYPNEWEEEEEEVDEFADPEDDIDVEDVSNFDDIDLDEAIDNEELMK